MMSALIQENTLTPFLPLMTKVLLQISLQTSGLCSWRVGLDVMFGFDPRKMEIVLLSKWDTG